MSDSDIELSWRRLKQWTPARIALGRAGNGLPTREYLHFEFALAQARDAVQESLDRGRLAADFHAIGLETVHVHSHAKDRQEFLLRPELGRQLDCHSRERLAPLKSERDLAVVVADGLSARAAQSHAVPVISAIRTLTVGKLQGPVILAEQARVAIGDDIAGMLGARAVAVLLGERPGLSAPDSLSIYFTHHPRASSTDAERNCVSNVRLGGLSYDTAAQELVWLLNAARNAGFSGVALKQFAAGRGVKENTTLRASEEGC